jgi:alkaline phosphatase D
MRIAFTSCFNARVFQNQPVWDWIGQKRPDHLVLLGDSVYLDAPMPTPSVQDMSEWEFTQHLYRLYALQLEQPQFNALIKSMGRNKVWSIWDDHDFLWDDMAGAVANNDPMSRAKMMLSTAFQEAFRYTLANNLAPSTFPATANVVNPATAPLSTPSVSVAPGVQLHLTDGRTFRTFAGWLTSQANRTIFGSAQRRRLTLEFEKHPDAVHVLASSSVIARAKLDYHEDWHWIEAMAAKYKIIILSGDIHRNALETHQIPGAHPLYEATSSGAALGTLVIGGADIRNYGLLSIQDQYVSVSLFAQNMEDTRFALKIDRATWSKIPAGA